MSLRTETMSPPLARRRSKDARRRRPMVESLERRELMALDVASAFNLGAATGAVTIGRSIVDGSGNTYVAGGFLGKVAFSANQAPVPDSGATQDAFVAKYNPDGSLAWFDQFKNSDKGTGAVGSAAFDLVIDGGGVLTVVGATVGKTDFDPNPNSTADGSTEDGEKDDAFVVRLKATGEFLNARAYNDSGDGIFGRVAIDHNDGNIVVTGTFAGMHDVFLSGDHETAPVTASAATNDIIVAKFDPAKLSVVWSRLLGDTTAGQFAIGASLALDPSDNIYAVGASSFTTAVIARLTPAGLVTSQKFIGAKTNPGTTAVALDVTVDTAGNAYVVGDLKGSAINFNPGGTTLALDSAGGTVDGFVAKFDPSLTAVWAKRFGSSSTESTSGISDTGEGVGFDSAGYLNVAGDMVSGASYGPDASKVVLTTANSATVNSDIYTIQIDPSSGAFVAGQTYGGAGSDRMISFTMPPFTQPQLGRPALAGTYAPPITLGPRTLQPVGPVNLFFGTLTLRSNTPGGGGGGGGGGTTAIAPVVSAITASRAKKKIGSITLAVNTGLNAVNAGNFQVKAFKNKKKGFSVPVAVKSAVFDATKNVVTLTLARPQKGPLQVSIAAGGLTSVSGGTLAAAYRGVVS